MTVTTPTQLVDLDQLEGDDYNYAVTRYLAGLSAAQQGTLVANLKNYVVQKNCTVTGFATASGDTDESAVISGLPLGYYYVVKADVDSKTPVTGLSVNAGGALVELNQLEVGATNVNVALKQSKPTIDKTILHNETGKYENVGDSQIGDTVCFRSEATLPTVETLKSFADNNETYIYTITDTMSDGLNYIEGSFKPSTVSYDDDTQLDNNYISNSDTKTNGEGFSLNIDVSGMYSDYSAANKLANFPTKLYISYSAVLTEDAVVAGNKDNNEITLEYSNSFNTTETITDTVYHYTFQLDVSKVDDEGAPLAGAEFHLYEITGDENIPKTETEMNLTKVEGVDGNPTKYYVDTAATLPNGQTGYIVTDTTGFFEIYGLDDATQYMLREVKAPEGYNAAADFEFKFNANYPNGTTDKTAPTVTLNENADTSITIVNRKHVFLPSTGGMGTVLFPVVGGGLMLGAVVILMMNKRKNAPK